MKNLIATVAVVALALGTATAQNNTITVRTGGVNATLVAPATGGPYTFTLPTSSGTLITTPAGVSGVVNYGTASAQTSETDGSRFLFNLEYTPAVAGNSVGARINVAPTGPGTDLNATALTLSATGIGTGTSTALDIVAGRFRIASAGVPASVDMTNRELVAYNTSTNLIERVTVATALGGTPVLYGVGGPQATLANGAQHLFNLEYSGTIDVAAVGARIHAVTTIGSAPNANATGLTLSAVTNGTGTSTALSVAGSGATDAANNYAIDVTGGTVRLSNTSRTVYSPAVVAVGNGDAVAPSATYLELTMGDPGAGAITASLAAGAPGQVIYLRVGKPVYASANNITFNVGDTPVINAAGNAVEGAQVVHAIYTNAKWEVLSNVTAIP